MIAHKLEKDRKESATLSHGADTVTTPGSKKKDMLKVRSPSYASFGGQSENCRSLSPKQQRSHQRSNELLRPPRSPPKPTMSTRNIPAANKTLPNFMIGIVDDDITSNDMVESAQKNASTPKRKAPTRVMSNRTVAFSHSPSKNKTPVVQKEEGEQAKKTVFELMMERSAESQAPAQRLRKQLFGKKKEQEEN